MVVMSTGKDEKPIAESGNKQSSNAVIWGTIGDTTWRMFVPTILGIVGGFEADQALHTLPWLTFVGMIVGGIFAGVLVRRQLRRVKGS